MGKSSSLVPREAGGKLPKSSFFFLVHLSLSFRLPMVLGLLTSSLIISFFTLCLVESIVIHPGQTQCDPDCMATHLPLPASICVICFAIVLLKALHSA